MDGDLATDMKAVERLDAAEKKYRSLVEQIPLITYTDATDEHSSAIYMSPQIEPLLGYSVDEWLKDRRLFRKLLHPDDRERVLAEAARTNLSGEPFCAEYRLIARDGTVRWFRDEAVHVTDSSDRPLYCQGYLLDITERKEIEERLRKAEAKYRTLIEQVPLATYTDTVDEDSSAIYMSPQIEPLLGYSVAEWLADPKLFTRLLHPDDRERVLAKNTRFNAEGGNFSCEYRLHARDGRVVWVRDEASLVRDERGCPLYSQGYLLDITEQRLAQRYADAQHAVTRVLAKASVSDDVIPGVLEALGCRLGWDYAACWTFDQDTQTLRCQSSWYISQALEEFDRVSKQIELTPGSGLPGRVWKAHEPAWIEDLSEDTNFPRSEQTSLAGLRSGICLPISSGTAILCVVEFFSREKQSLDPGLIDTMATTSNQIGQFLERKRADERADRSKDEFIRLTSHELRTPLTSIMGYTDLVIQLQEEAGVSGQQRRSMEIVQRNTKRLLRLINDLLFAAQITAQDLSLCAAEVDLKALTSECIKLARPAMDDKNIELTAHLEAVPPIEADDQRLLQVVENLLSNATKFTEEGGAVEVVLRHDDSYAILEVSDTGIGIGPDEQEHIFRAFARSSGADQRAIPGVGLGLTIVKAVVERHGGEVSVTSRKEMGSTFQVRLPLK